jgi:hypothetical protein
MTEERNALTDLFAACWKDDALKARFMADPKAVLAERGIEMPDGMDVTVVENSDNTVHITLPMAPGGHAELSDEELSNAAGGGAASLPMLVCVENTGMAAGGAD